MQLQSNRTTSKQLQSHTAASLQLEIYIYRFTDKGLLLHSYTVKSLQPQSRAEQSRYRAKHVSATVQVSATIHVSATIQVWATQVSVIVRFTAQNSQIYSQRIMAYSYRAILLQNNRLQATEFVWKIHFSAHYCWTMLNKHGQVKTIQHSFKQANTHKSNLTYNFLPFIIYTMIRLGSSVSNSNFSFSFYMFLIL